MKLNSMKKITIILTCFISFIHINAQITPTKLIAKTINVQVAGTLSTLISNDDMYNISNLILTGNIDARDIKCFYSMYNLSVLDLSETNIMEYYGTGGVGPNPYTEIRLYPANEMPTYSFVFLDFNSTLTSLILPRTLKTIANNALYNCRSLSSVTMYDSLIVIGDNAFNSCYSLTYINIPKGVTTIASNAFNDCVKIGEYNVNSENSYYTSLDGVIYNKDTTILFAYPKAKSGEYVIPSTVISIGNLAFDHCTNLTKIQIPNSVSEIGEMAFRGCSSINTITIPNKVKRINNQTFEFCSYLNTVNFPDSLTYIGKYAFCVCEDLNNLSIPKKVSYIGDFAFAQCTKLTSISLPDSIKSINEWLFNMCSNLKEIVIPDKVDTIKYGAFQSCGKLENLKIGKDVIFIDSRCFFDCVSLKSIYSYTPYPADLNQSLNVFTNINKTNCILYVPKGSKELYKAANQWKDFTIIEEMTTGIIPVSISDIKIKTENGSCIIENAKAGNKVEIFNISGVKIKEQLTEDNQTKIKLKRGIYIIHVDNYSYKVSIK